MSVCKQLAAALALSCSLGAAQAEEVHLYSWSDYFGQDTIAKFTAETGIKVVYDVFDNNDIVETKVLTGGSGYDVVTPNFSPHFLRQLDAKAWATLDKTKLANVGNVSPGIDAQIAAGDPGNTHSVPWMWGTTGIIVNRDKVDAILPNAPLDSFAMLFDPAIAEKLSACGIAMLDDGEQVLGSVLIWQGKSINTATQADLDGAVALIDKLRPFVRKFHSSAYIAGLVDGDFCVALGFSGDARVAALRAKEAGRPAKIEYHLPKEGALMFFDVLAIPADAPNPAAGLKFIDFVLKAEIGASAADWTGFATANAKALELVDPALKDDPNLYPPADRIAALTVPRVFSQVELKSWHKAWDQAMGRR
ncbi:MAG: extracellular solute-binding protein [Rhizobiaceae bacterium]